jgi:hypothetical protein
MTVSRKKGNAFTIWGMFWGIILCILLIGLFAVTELHWLAYLGLFAVAFFLILAFLDIFILSYFKGHF